MSTVTIAERIGEELVSRGWVVGTAESCTGGMVAAALTDIAGSSRWFEEGLVTYANGSKAKLLGVPEALLAEEGAVSEATVKAMVAGVLRGGADTAIATSGIAGPGGGSSEKPVGTVWFAWATKDRLYCEKKVFDGDRFDVRIQATHHALEGVLDLIKSTV